MSIWQVQVKKLLFRVASVGKIFKQEIDEIFKALPNIFGPADDILIIGYNDDGRDHDRKLRSVITDMLPRKLKAEQKQMLFHNHKVAIFW